MLRQINRFVFASFVLFVAAATSYATPNLTLRSGSTLQLLGDSTLHAFTAKSSQTLVTTELDAQAVSTATSENDVYAAVLEKKALKRMDVVVPVKTLKSKEAALDRNMYKALKAEQYPEITFHLASYAVSPSTASPNASHVKTNGTLQICGHEKPVELDSDVIIASGTFHVQGDYPLLMSDYGVKPPTLMMGTIKVRDRIVVRFDLLFGLEPQHP